MRHLVYTSIRQPLLASKFETSPSHFATEEYLRASSLTYNMARTTLDLVPTLVGQ